MSLKNNKIAIVSGCVLCPAFQAVESEKNAGWSFRIAECLLKNGYNIVPLTCPEITYKGIVEGRVRGKHGVDYYSRDIEFVNHCKRIAEMEAEKIKEMVEAGFSVEFILGIENSPTCAVNYMYTHKGMRHRMGIFYEFLYKELLERNIEVPFIGVNRGHIKQIICELDKKV